MNVYDSFLIIHFCPLLIPGIIQVSGITGYSSNNELGLEQVGRFFQGVIVNQTGSWVNLKFNVNFEF